MSLGFGTARDDSSMRRFGPGSFYVNPPGVPHYVFSEPGAVLQIADEGAVARRSGADWAVITECIDFQDPCRGSMPRPLSSCGQATSL